MEACPVKPLDFAQSVAFLKTAYENQRVPPAQLRHWTNMDATHWARVVAFYQFVCVAWEVRMGDVDVYRPPDSPGDNAEDFCCTILRSYRHRHKLICV